MSNVDEQIICAAAAIKSEVPEDQWDKRVVDLLRELDDMGSGYFERNEMLIKVQYAIEHRLEDGKWRY